MPHEADLHVVRDGDGWGVKWEGSDHLLSKHRTQAEAYQAARELAKHQGGGELVIHRPDGRIRSRIRFQRDALSAQERQERAVTSPGETSASGLGSTGDLVAQYFLVGFMDMVGQKDLLRELAQRPLEDVDAEEVRMLLRRTFGTLKHFRKIIQDHCESSKEPVIDLSKLSEVRQREFRALVAGRVYLQPLSDAMILYVPLAEDGALSINGAYTALCACAQAMLLSMAAGRPCRGGIDVGWAAKINDGEIYGPARPGRG
jgi:Uncharacterized protein conserved in bacteria (DUF2188)